MDEGTVHIGAMRVEVHLPGVSSLKGKRAQLNRVKAALARELSVSVTEAGYQDLWQRSVLGIAVAASSETGVDRVLERVVAVIERDPRVIVTRTASWADTVAAGDDDLPDGAPPFTTGFDPRP